MMGSSTSAGRESSGGAGETGSYNLGGASSTGGGETDATGGEAGLVSRRGFIRATGATVAAGAAAAAADEGSAQAQSYEFGGEVQGWQGRAPSAIEGEQNPTLELQAGQQYEVTWENLDGAPHDFTIQDDGGSNLAGTDLVREQGSTASFTFTASPEMTQYVCTVHPSTMVGDIRVSGGAQGGAQGGEESGIRLSLLSMLMVGAILLAFVSPLLFALFLFSRRGTLREGTVSQR